MEPAPAPNRRNTVIIGCLIALVITCLLSMAIVFFLLPDALDQVFEDVLNTQQAEEMQPDAP